jgi:hypothetical protein
VVRLFDEAELKKSPSYVNADFVEHGGNLSKLTDGYGLNNGSPIRVPRAADRSADDAALAALRICAALRSDETRSAFRR